MGNSQSVCGRRLGRGRPEQEKGETGDSRAEWRAKIVKSEPWKIRRIKRRNGRNRSGERERERREKSDSTRGHPAMMNGRFNGVAFVLTSWWLSGQ